MTLLFRHYREQDADILRDAADDHHVRLHTYTIPVNPTLDWSKDRIATSVTERQELFGLFDGDKLVAEAGWFLDEQDSLEIGYMVPREARGKGYGRRAISELISYLRQDKHYTGPILAKVTKDNETSIHILEKACFVRVGEGEHFSKGRGRLVQNWHYVINKIDQLDNF